MGEGTDVHEEIFGGKDFKILYIPYPVFDKWVAR